MCGGQLHLRLGSGCRDSADNIISGLAMVKVAQDEKTIANKDHKPDVIFTEFVPTEDRTEEEEVLGVSVTFFTL